MDKAKAEFDSLVASRQSRGSSFRRMTAVMRPTSVSVASAVPGALRSPGGAKLERAPSKEARKAVATFRRPSKEGWLQRIGKKKWERKYFVLKDGRLSQFNKPGETGEGKGMSVAGCTVRLVVYKSQDASAETPNQFSLCLADAPPDQPPWQNMFALAADSAFDKASWVDALTNAINVETYASCCNELGTSLLQGPLEAFTQGDPSMALDNVVVLGSEFAAVCKTLSNNTSVVQLSVENALLADAFIKESLTPMLVQNKGIVNLSLRGNRLSDDSIIDLCEALTVNFSIASLDLSQNEISHVGAMHIAELIKINECVIKLDVSDNQIGKDGGKAFGAALSSKAAVTDLSLAGNSIQSEGALALAKGLESVLQPALHRLDLSNNDIGSDGIAALIGALDKQDKLSELDLSGNKMDKSNATAVNQLLKERRNIIRFKCSNNPTLGTDGIEAIATSVAPGMGMTLQQLTLVRR